MHAHPEGCLDSGFWILDSGFWILDSGFWIFWILSFTCVSAPARSVDRPGHKAIAPVHSPWHDPSIVQATRCGRTQQPYSEGPDDW